MKGRCATTGTCAAAAAKAAALHARGSRPSRNLEIALPGGGRTQVEILAWGGHPARPWASVRKPSSEDPDATREAVVVVSLRRSERMVFRAGAGVGTITRPGLQLPVGEPAINPVPRCQIEQALVEIGAESWEVTISVLGGAALAARTFNPRLGIADGLSILGTSGLVRPWCTAAFLGSVDAHLGVVRAKGQTTALLVPGRMGERAAARLAAGLECVEVGNSWGEAVDLVRRHRFTRLVAVGHPGKLVKIAQGQWDTHSSAGSSASVWAARFLRRVLGREEGLLPTSESDTLEGLLAPLAPALRYRASSRLAQGVARRLERRSGMPSVVVFVDLNGNLLGEAAT